MTTSVSRTKACSDRSQWAWATFKTAWGWVGAQTSPRGLTRLSLPLPTQSRAQRVVALPGVKSDSRSLADVARHVRSYFEREPIAFTLAVDIRDLPPFCAAALNAARRIPYGQTATYREIARRLGNPAASRAVGQAMARNPVPIVIPCHRVVSSTGLGGFSAPGGLAMKTRLLAMEGIGPFPR